MAGWLLLLLLCLRSCWLLMRTEGGAQLLSAPASDVIDWQPAMLTSRQWASRADDLGWLCVWWWVERSVSGVEIAVRRRHCTARLSQLCLCGKLYLWFRKSTDGASALQCRYRPMMMYCRLALVYGHWKQHANFSPLMNIFQDSV